MRCWETQIIANVETLLIYRIDDSHFEYTKKKKKKSL